MTAGVAAILLPFPPASVAAEGNFLQRGLGRYIKKKALDPLDTYVPVVIEARGQLQQAGTVMEANPATARELLRVGPFNSLRENIRALGQYAVVNGQQQDSAPLVNGFFQSVERFDRILYDAVKRGAGLQGQDLSDAQSRLQEAAAALDKLLDTVPRDIYDRSKSILAAAAAKEPYVEEAAAAAIDEQALQQILQPST